MQNRYACDVGDFMKLGLLRQLAAPAGDGGSGMRMGLNWYLGPDEAHNGDGKHIAYLDPSNGMHRSLAGCDRDLIERLARVVAVERSVAALDRSGTLPPGSRTHSEMLAPSAGLVGRRAWHRRALDALAGADVVCADPDNGIRPAAAAPKLHKYALLEEMADYARRGQSLVVYQHADRSADARTQAARRLEQLSDGVGQPPVAAIIARRGSCRFLLITGTDGHRDRLAAALESFAERWSPHAELVGGVPGRRGGDSNPRTRSTPVTRFPVAPVQPLRHLSRWAT